MDIEIPSTCTIIVDGETQEITCTHQWQITETKAPDGYLAAASPTNGLPTTFTYQDIPEDGFTYEWADTPTPDPQELTIMKVDADTGAVVGGAWFTVRNIDTGVTRDYYSSNGVLTLHNDSSNQDGYYLTGGSYAVTEKIAPYNYTLSTETQYFNFNEYGESGGGTLTFEDYWNPTVKITKLDENSGAPISGAIFSYSFNGSPMGTVGPTGSEGYVELTNLQTGYYTFKEVSVPGYIVSDQEYEVYVDMTSGQRVYPLKITDYKLKTLVLAKEDAFSGDRLAGAKFTIERLDSTGFSPIVTDYTGSDGTVSVSGLDYGTYVITETQAPAGYELTAAPVTIVLSEETTSDVIEVPAFRDNRLPSLEIRKVDANDPTVPIPNVTFSYSIDTTDMGTVTTDTNGRILLPDIVSGTYTFKEEIVPEGYIKSDKVWFIEIDAENYDESKPYSLTISNYQKKSIIIKKVDAETLEPLDGAEFTVTRKDTSEVVDTVTTGTIRVDGEALEGAAIVSGLDYGAYVITETAAPKGYEVATDPYVLVLNEDTTADVITIPTFKDNQKPRIELTKIDANSDEPIPGVIFDYWLDGTYIGQTEPTDKNGLTTLTELESGTYTFKEAVVPDTYIKTDNVYTIEVDTSKAGIQKLYSKTIENYLKKTLVIIKEDAENGWRLADAEFTITGTNTGFTDTVTTDETGTAFVTGLVYDTYTITETRAPNGYEVASPITISLTSDDPADTPDVITLPTFFDAPEPTLIIRKVDATTNQPIPNVSFSVGYQSDSGLTTKTYTTDSNGIIAIPDVKTGWYVLAETSTPSGYVKADQSQTVQVTSTNEPTVVTFENKQLSAVNILKLDAQTGLPLPGAVFVVRKVDGTKVATVTTGAEGYATVTGLAPGSYVVREQEAPNHHVVDPDPQYFEITEDDSGSVVTLVFRNNNKTNLYIRKIDADTKSGLAGAEFKVTTLDGTVVAEKVTTGENGLALVTDLDAGAIVVTETKAPEGYLITESAKTIQIVDSKTVTVEFSDDKPGAIAVKKIDAASQLALAGAEFSLYSLDDQLLTAVTTQADGYARIGDLTPGYYVLKETKAPEGYQADMEPIKVKVEAFSTTEVVVENTQKSSLTIEKRDKETNVLLPGATFQITTLEGTVVADALTTSESGTVTYAGLAEGSYYVTETAAPSGYLLDSDAQLVTVTGDQASIVTFYDQAKKGLTINKVDAQSFVPLSGATFELYGSSGALIGTYVTDTSGSVTTQALEPGRYTLREVKAPDGYDIGWTPESTLGGVAGTEVKVSEQSIDIEAGSFTEITIPNTAKTALEIQKTDSVTGAPLAGAVFTVKDESGNIITTVTTGVDGNVFTEPLAQGWYSVSEVTAPEGYLLNTEDQAVQIKDGVASILRFADIPATALTIVKTDTATHDPLAGAVFELRTLTGDSVGRYETGENGTVTTEALVPGTYVLVEVTAPNGYALNNNSVQVTVEAGKANSVSVADNALATLTVYKADSKGSPLPGATIKLETADGVFIAQGVTDSAGEIIFTGLTEGHYTATEVAAPTGYEMDSDPVTTWVAYNQTNRIEMSNAQWGGLVVKLTDQKDGSPLANGKFVVTHCIDNSIVYTGTTDEAGTMMVGSLIPGDKYIVTQVLAPDGYTMTETEQSEFIVAGENKIVLFENVTAGIVIEKVDAVTGDTLAGARFQLTRNEDNIVIGEYVTGTDGLAIASGLIPGMYTVEELKAPENYTIDEPSQLVHVKSNETAHVTFKNTPYSGITMISKDSLGNNLAGTVFEVYVQNGELVNSYVTDSAGTVQTGVLEPGYYVIKVVDGKSGYVFNDTERTVEIKDGVSVTETFTAVGQGTVNIYSLDNAYKALPGMRGTITKINGEYVKDFLTGSDGLYTVTGLAPGWYVVKETKAPENYQTDGATSKNILVYAGSASDIYFLHNKNYGLQVNTTVEQTGQPLEGVKYKVAQVNGEDMGSYVSNSAGRLYVGLEPGDYIVTPVSLPGGYTMDMTPKTVAVDVNGYASVEFVATQLSSIRVKIVDSGTKTGVYGVRLLLKDSAGNVISEYWTNNEGYITLSQTLVNGDYLLEQITVPDGFVMDSVPKSVKVLNGETTEIVWEISRVVGQIQVELRSQDYNEVIGKDANSLLYNGQFQIIDATTYQVVDTMTSDIYGVAASNGIPLGRYYIKQVTAPNYYGVSDQVSEVTLKISGDVVRVNFWDPSLKLGVDVEHKGNQNVTAGQTMRLDVTAVNNLSTVPLTNVYWTIKIPTDCARVGTVYTGAWNQAVWYNVSYKTNMTDYRDLAKNLNSTANNQFDLSSTALNLQSGEYVTELRYEFIGTIPVNFTLTDNPSFMLYVLPGVYNGYKLISRMEFGGLYNDAWVSDTSLWTVNVLNDGNKTAVILPWDGTTPWDNIPSQLPKTGY